MTNYAVDQGENMSVSTQSVLADLAARVRGATGPSRELDHHIHAAVHGRVMTFISPGGYHYEENGKPLFAYTERLTENLDVALAMLSAPLSSLPSKLEQPE